MTPSVSMLAILTTLNTKSRMTNSKSNSQTFIADLKNDTVNSRSNKALVDKYGASLSKSLTGDRSKPVPISKAATLAGSRATKKAPKKPRKIARIQYHKDMENLLKALGSGKLERLHYSICEIALEPHTPLLTVGFGPSLSRLLRSRGAMRMSTLSRSSATNASMNSEYRESHKFYGTRSREFNAMATPRSTTKPPPASMGSNLLMTLTLLSLY